MYQEDTFQVYHVSRRYVASIPCVYRRYVLSISSIQKIPFKYILVSTCRIYDSSVPCI